MCRKKMQIHCVENLKRFVLFLFFILQVGNGYSQSRYDSEYKSILEKCNCPSRIINTDSVYSFLKAVNLDEMVNKDFSYMLRSKPFTLDEFKNVAESGSPFFWREMIRNRYSTTDTTQMKRLISLYSATLDSTTTFTRPITAWDISEFPEEWLHYNEKNTISDLINSTPWVEEHYPSKRKDFKNKKQQKAFKDGIDYARQSSGKRLIDISLSIPVFDKDYEYAFLFIANNRWSDISGACAFIIYRRDPKKGWVVWISGNKNHENLGYFDGYMMLNIR